MHNNLFTHGDRRAVYESLQRDCKRDHRQCQIMDVALFATVAFLARHLSGWDFAAVVVATVVVISRINTFVDNSNRNFLMHMIDWMDARDAERAHQHASS
jgi:hypothetical protein